MLFFCDRPFQSSQTRISSLDEADVLFVLRGKKMCERVDGRDDVVGGSRAQAVTSFVQPPS